MYYEFEGRQNMKTLIFDEQGLTVGDKLYSNEEIDHIEVTSAPLFATYGILTLVTYGKDVIIPFPRTYASKIRRAIHEMEREREKEREQVREKEEERTREKRHDIQAESATPGHPQTSVSLDPYEEVKKLKELLDLDIISKEEFEKKKKELLHL